MYEERNDETVVNEIKEEIREIQLQLKLISELVGVVIMFEVDHKCGMFTLVALALHHLHIWNKKRLAEKVRN